MTAALDQPSHRLLIAEMVLSGSGEPLGSTSRQLAATAARCIDWADLFAASLHGKFTSTEAACINRKARDAKFVELLAASIDGTAERGSEEQFGQPLLECLTAARLVELGRNTPT